MIGTMNIHINAQFVCTTQDVKKRYKTVLGWGGVGWGAYEIRRRRVSSVT